MAGRKIADAADARRCLAACASSGGSRVEWARRHGVDARSLNMWRLNLGQREVRPRLVELVPTATRSTAPFVVRLGELAVDVPADFDSDALRRLLAVVAPC